MKKNKEEKKIHEAIIPQGQMKRLKKLFSIQSGDYTAVNPNRLN